EASSEDDDLMIVADEDSSVAPSSPDAMSLDALIAEPDVSAVAPDTVENLIASTDSVLVDDVDEDEARSSSVDLSSISDDDVLSTASDSGLALLGGSSDDIVLGGSGSGSGSALSLDSSDSGISLLGGGSDSGFDLSGGADDQGIFELQEEGQDGAYNLVEETPDVLNLEPEADPDAPTELGSDESVFELIDETSVTTGDDTSSSDVDSASSLIETEDSSLYSTDEPTDNGPMTSDDALFTTDDEEPDPFGPFAGAAATADTTAGFASNPFETDDTQPDDGGNPFDSMSDGFGGDAFGGFDGSDPNAAASGIDANSFGDDESPFVEGVSADDLPGQGLGVARAKVNSSDIRGMDFLLLAPCLIFLILATIGAVELCRTIWSYQEGTGAIAGPILESIAKMVKLI
ncbi:MAG: hypothetical protein Q4G03_03920, partial [Planctomycetia bacterium]|nr:hypothetical protein [Planctomycetia bacterium]